MKQKEENITDKVYIQKIDYNNQLKYILILITMFNRFTLNIKKISPIIVGTIAANGLLVYNKKQPSTYKIPTFNYKNNLFTFNDEQTDDKLRNNYYVNKDKIIKDDSYEDYSMITNYRKFAEHQNIIKQNIIKQNIIKKELEEKELEEKELEEKELDVFIKHVEQQNEENQKMTTYKVILKTIAITMALIIIIFEVAFLLLFGCGIMYLITVTFPYSIGVLVVYLISLICKTVIIKYLNDKK